MVIVVASGRGLRWLRDFTLHCLGRISKERKKEGKENVIKASKPSWEDFAEEWLALRFVPARGEGVED